MSINAYISDAGGRPVLFDGSSIFAIIFFCSSSEYNKSGIAIDNVQNDYYQTNGTYRNVKEVINIMNPAPIK